ncbi:MAG: histidinol dehydrogenase [Candidatus Bipolaricaulia bacterium]
MITPKQLVGLSNEERYRILNRGWGTLEAVVPAVSEIIATVRRRGDAALIEYTERFDGIRLSDSEIRVSEETLAEAYAAVGEAILAALRKSASHIEAYHKPQHPEGYELETAPGVRIGRRVVAYDRVGIYVPGGNAAYPSSVLMASIPARIAGVSEIALCTPPEVSAAVLATARIVGIDEVYQVGGAQAIAALAYGTESIRPVAKIVGPGNRYVTAAKERVRDVVAIDLPAGPSEIAVIAEPLKGWPVETLARWIAVDLAAQLEHGPDTSALLLTSSRPLAETVADALNEQVGDPDEKHIAVLLCDDLDEAIAFVDTYAPEHLEIITETEDPESVLKRVHNVGSVFLGPYAPVAIGDYCSGTNHILPTMGAARRFSGLGIKDFLKEFSYQAISRDGLAHLSTTAATLADVEGLSLHKRSVEIRLEDEWR